MPGRGLWGNLPRRLARLHADDRPDHAQPGLNLRFSAAEDIVAQETIPVLGWSLDKEPSNADWEPGDGAREGLVFKLTHPGSGDVAFCAENMNIAARWIALLADAVTLESD